MKYKCPECRNDMILLEKWDSLLKIGKWYKYGCEYCSGIFEIKKFANCRKQESKKMNYQQTQPKEEKEKC